MAVDPVDTPIIVKLGEGFYVRQAIDNLAWIDMGEYAIVIDALEEAHFEDEIFDAIAETLGDKKVRYLLNTHSHYDHVSLNSAFQRRHGTEIINQRTSSIPPEGLLLEGAKRRIMMIPLPDCHTAEDCIIWAPDERALFTGDIFGWGLISLCRALNIDSAAVLKQGYEKLIAYDPLVVIPGHGPLCSNIELQRFPKYFDWLCEQALLAVAANETDQQIAARLAPPKDMLHWWRFTQWKHQDSVNRVIRAARKGNLDPAK